MIRKFKYSDLDFVSEIWLDTNIKAHNFIEKEYFISNLEEVKKAFLDAEIYVYENDKTKEIQGFIGLIGNYIAGIFVKYGCQSKGIGKNLLDYTKTIKSSINLKVYKKNNRGVNFYLREGFSIKSEDLDDFTKEVELNMAWEK